LVCNVPHCGNKFTRRANIMDTKYAITLADSILDGRELSKNQLRELADVPDSEVFQLLPGANILRDAQFGNRIHLCTISNAKSGKCSEDCAFCAP